MINFINEKMKYEWSIYIIMNKGNIVDLFLGSLFMFWECYFWFRKKLKKLLYW